MMNWLGKGVLVAMVVAGCGGGGGGTTVTVADFCAQKADKECQVVDSCGTADKPTCLVARKAECMTLAADAQVAPRIFRAANISACINQTSSVYATKGTITPMQLDMMNEACQYVFQGDVAESSPCKVKYDCTGTLICDKGVCAKKTTKNATELCGNPGEICNTGSICTMMGAVYKCLPKGMLAAMCDETTPCLETLHCVGGKCAERAAVGGACTSNGDCASTVPYCDPYIGNKCDKGLTFGGGAAACAAFGGMASGSGGSAGTGGASGSGGAAGTDAADDGGGDDGAATD